MKSTFIGRAVTVLLVFSAISYAKGYIQPQDPKPTQQPVQQPVPQAQTSNQLQDSKIADPSSLTGPAKSPVEPVPAVNEMDLEPVVAAQTYTATAYSLRGRTASGQLVSRGLIAADPSVLPLGTRVRVEAGSFSGEYLVADTGGAVKGHHIDIWTPSTREALQFGRRAVKLTVLSFGGKRARPASSSVAKPASASLAKPTSESVRPRRVNPLTPPIPSVVQQDK
jgi:3D (Asp-Asp-Asp) domain-containing protein